MYRFSRKGSGAIRYIHLLKPTITLNPDRDLRFQFSHRGNMAPYQIFCLFIALTKFMMHIGNIEYHNLFFQSFLPPLQTNNACRSNDNNEYMMRERGREKVAHVLILLKSWKYW